MIEHAPRWIALLPTLGVAAALLLAAVARAQEPPDLVDPSPWARILAHHQRAGGLDYAALQQAGGDLDLYLAALAKARLADAARPQLAAFWINAYNAVVARFVLDSYPEIESVKDEQGFFDRRRQTVAGRELTLDEIEDRALEAGGARVHFAVVCASTSCPDLRDEPYLAARLDAQLEEQTRAFLADPSKGMRFDRDAGTVWLSSIFMWYANDFTGGSRVVAFFARGRVLDWVLDHLPATLASEIEKRRPGVRYLDYDWSLNDRPAPQGGGG